jgi:hypothetical protein
MSTVGYSGFPAFSQLHSLSLLTGGATTPAAHGVFYLRTVIVRSSFPTSLQGPDHLFIPLLQRGSSAYGL